MTPVTWAILLLVLGLVQQRQAIGESRRRIPVPWFVIAFVAVLLLNSAITVHPQLRSVILQGDQFLFLMVMIALGLTTPVTQLPGGGAMRLIGAGVFALVLSALVAYALVRSTQGMSMRAQPGASPVLPVGDGDRLFNAVGCAKCHVPTMRGVRWDVTL